jgi:hypothetical protein
LLTPNSAASFRTDQCVLPSLPRAFGSHPDFEDQDDDLPFEDLEPGIAEANVALIESSVDEDSSEAEER